MSVTRRELPASQALVFAVLSIPTAYGSVVPGACHIRSFDPRWPAPGSWMAHTSGIGPFVLRDLTIVRDACPPDFLTLEAHLHPFGVAEVTFRLAESPTGCAVSVEEVPVSGLIASPRLARVVSGAIALRNAELCRRLQREVARRQVREETGRGDG